MKTRLIAGTSTAAVVLAGAAALLATASWSTASAETSVASGLDPDWASVSTWQDGLVEKATYEATHVLYGRARTYEAIFLTNREVHEPATWTKSPVGEGIEVWKHNQIEVVPTPNYDYKYLTTSHLRSDDLSLTRLDATSQEWCGTSFHHFLLDGNGWAFTEFSYMPGAGFRSASVADSGEPLLAFNALPISLRSYDFEAKPDLPVRLILDQRSNRSTKARPVDATIRYAGETDEGHQLDVIIDGQRLGRFEFAKDRDHLMLSYDGRDGQTYKLKGVDRVNYWTINE
ncbi:MAG: hypothetical protein AAGI46_14035 [Planctomycetota bacterium]